MYIEAETLSSRTYCESCFACLTAYLAYLCMETHYEKVRNIKTSMYQVGTIWQQKEWKKSVQDFLAT